jgi:hypothetical protein
MAVDSGELDKKIMDAFFEYNTGAYKNEKVTPKHLKILGDTMKVYFEGETEVIYSWEAYLPPPASSPDPVKSFKSTVSFPSFDLMAANNLITLAALIQAAVIGGKINHPSGFEVSTGSFLAVTPLVLAQTTTLSGAFFNCISRPTCSWYLTCKNPAPLKGKHGTYSGATTGMEIK